MQMNTQGATASWGRPSDHVPRAAHAAFSVPCRHQCQCRHHAAAAQHAQPRPCSTIHALTNGAALTDTPGQQPPQAQDGIVYSSGSSDPPQSLSQLIGQALQEAQGSTTSQQSDLVQTLDLLGGGVTACVTRTWEARDAWLEVSGTWESGEEARRTAMLSVYHERVWLRNQQLGRMFQLLARHRPGTVPPEAVERVTLAMRQNTMCGATEALAIQDLMLMAVAWLDNDSIMAVIDQVAEETGEELRKQPWVARDPARKASMQLQLTSLRAAWRYQAALSTIRLHHARGIAATTLALEKLKAQRSKNTAPAIGSLWMSQDPQDSVKSSNNQPPAGSSVLGSMSDGSGLAPTSVPGGQSVWAAALKEVDYVIGQVAAFDKVGLTGPGCGRVGQVSFGRGTQPPPLQPTTTTTTTTSSDTLSNHDSDSADQNNEDNSHNTRSGSTGVPASQTHVGRTRGTLYRDEGGSGGAVFGSDLVRELRAAHLALQELEAAKQATRGSFSMGAALSFEKCLRRHLLDLLCTWADQHPEEVPTQALQTHCTHSTNIRTSSQEHASRRVTVRVEGPQLPWMREAARKQGRTFLDGWMPYVGNPYKGKEEWDYISDAPPSWHRYVSIPANNTHHTRITLFWRHTQPPSPAPTHAPSAPASQPPSSAVPSTPSTTTGAQEASQSAPADSASGAPQSQTPVSLVDEKQAEIQVPLGDLQQFMAALLQVVPAATSLAAGQAASGQPSSSGTPSPAATRSSSAANGAAGQGGKGQWVGPASVQLQYAPLPVPSSGDPQAPSDFLIRWLQQPPTATEKAPGLPQYRTERLLCTHIQSLLTLYDNVSDRLPELLPVPGVPDTLHQATAGGGGWSGRGNHPLLRAGRFAVRTLALAALAVSVPMALGVRLLGWSTHPLNSLSRNSAPYVEAPALPLPPSTSTRTSSTPAATATGSQQQRTSGSAPARTLAAAAQSAASAQQPGGVGPQAVVAAGLQPVLLGAEELQRLADSVRLQVENRLWLPLVPQGRAQSQQQGGPAQDTDLTTEETETAQAQALQDQQNQQYRRLDLRYQVVVSRSGQVLGCMPLDKVSAKWYPQLPLAGMTRSEKIQDQQDRYISSCLPNAEKPQAPGKFSGLGSQAQYRPLPLHTPAPNGGATDTAAASAADAFQGNASAGAEADVAVFLLRLSQLHDVKEAVGNSGQQVALMAASVTQWTDMDSLVSWAAHGADIRLPAGARQPPPAPSMRSAGSTESGSGVGSTQRVSVGQAVDVRVPGSVQTGPGGGGGGGMQQQGSQWEQLFQQVMKQLLDAVQTQTQVQDKAAAEAPADKK